MLLLFFGIGCPDPRIDSLESKLAATESRATQLETKVAAMESEMAAIRTAHAIDQTPFEKDVTTGELAPVLDEKAVVSCAMTNLQGIATAEAAYDAAFDTYKAELDVIGWTADRSRGCHRYLAFRVTPKENERGVVDDFVATAVITRGTGVGRTFQIDRTNTVTEGARLSGAEMPVLVE